MPTMPKEVKSLLKVAEAQGFTWGLTAKNHVQVRDPEGRVISGMSGTPSDTRAIKNFRAQLRRGGVTIE